MVILGIDCGPTTHGVVVLNTRTGSVMEAHKAATTAEVLAMIGEADTVAIERYRAGGKLDADTCATIENVGRFWQQAIAQGVEYSLIYRAVVLSVLDTHGIDGTRDSKVRQALYQRFGGVSGSRKEAVGTKANPGKLYGVTSHSMQALGVAVTAEALL